MTGGLPGFDEVWFRLNVMHEQLQVRLDWYARHASSSLHNQAAKVFNAENRDYVVELVKRLIQQCSEHLRSNEGLQSVLRKFEVVVVSISRKVISPVVQQVFRSKARSALAGFIGGLAFSWLLWGPSSKSRQRGRGDSWPVKPQCISRAVTCKEPKDRKRFEGLDGLEVKEGLPAERVWQPDQVLVRVHASSVEPLDVSILSGLGRYERNPSDEDALVLGRDLSGVVAEVGLEVHHLAVGDKVWGLVPITQPTGAMTDYVVLNAAHVRRKPPKIGHEGACTVPFSGMTAWKSLHEAGVLPNSTSRGKTVLVVDATSATGCLAVQLARAWGASVVAVVNHRKLGPLATMLGATNVIVVDNDEYSESILLKALCHSEDQASPKLDAVIITSKFPDVAATFYHQFLKNSTRAASKSVVDCSAPERLESDTYGFIRRILLGFPGLGRLIFSSARSLAFHEREVRVILDELKRMVESGQVQPVLDSTCDVTNAALVQDAFQRTAGKSTIGKAVVTFVKSH